MIGILCISFQHLFCLGDYILIQGFITKGWNGLAPENQVWYIS